MKIGVFDLETRNWSDDVPGGSSNIQAFRMSLGVLNDRVYWEDGVSLLLSHLRACDLIVGFNLINFDYVVLQRYRPDFDFGSLPTFDILQDLTQRLGHRVSLDSLCEGTLETRKSGTGKKAVKWWREKKVQKLAAYCKRDVNLTKQIFEVGLRSRYLRFMSHGFHDDGRRTVRTDHWPDALSLCIKTSPQDAGKVFREDDIWTGLTQLKISTP